jgi:hypothetical protein
MEITRRKLLISLGAGAGAGGTGAFRAWRQRDRSTLAQLVTRVCVSPVQSNNQKNGEFASLDGVDTVTDDLNSVNRDSNTTIQELFNVKTRGIRIW